MGTILLLYRAETKMTLTTCGKQQWCDLLSTCFSFVGFDGQGVRGEGRENRALKLDNQVFSEGKLDQKRVLTQKVSFFPPRELRS